MTSAPVHRPRKEAQAALVEPALVEPVLVEAFFSDLVPDDSVFFSGVLDFSVVEVDGESDDEDEPVAEAVGRLSLR